MAQPTNTFDQYDAVGVREELADTIYNVAPFETPFFSGMRKSSADSTNPNWMTDTLRSSGANAHIEGDDTTATAATPTVRLDNQTQIFKNAFTLSGTIEATDRAGRAQEAAYQKVKFGREQKMDIEKALFDNNAKVVGSSTVARELAGVPAWLTTNTDAGSGGADATGDGTDARTDGTARAFTETQMNNVLQSIWENGGNPNTVYLSASNQTIAAGFEGNAPRRSDDDGKVNNFVDLYVTSWGRVEFMPSREVRSRDVLILQDNMWSVKELRPMSSTKLAKTGDSEKYQMLTELTLCAHNEAASGMIADTGA